MFRYCLYQSFHYVQVLPISKFSLCSGIAYIKDPKDLVDGRSSLPVCHGIKFKTMPFYNVFGTLLQPTSLGKLVFYPLSARWLCV